jgi:hypothetical protein
MYQKPIVIATFDADELLGEAYGSGNPGCGNEGNPNPVGNGSCESGV